MMLKTTNVEMGYGESQVLFGISLNVEKNEIVSLVGSNASGKSTLISGISGINRIWTGNIEFEGKDITKSSASDRVELGIIQCPEGRQLFPEMTVSDNLRMGAYCKRGRNDYKKNLDRVYGIFPKLQERDTQMAGSMSGGEQQMCAIGRALMANPKLLILDEPSLGLAPIIVQQVFEIIEAIRDENITILLVEQNVQKALKMCSRAYVMESGAIAMQGNGIELLGDENLRKAYLGI